MSALPSSAAAMDSSALTPLSAAGSLPAAAAAEQHALPTDTTHANAASLARPAVSVVPVDSAVDAHADGVTPVAAAAAVVELQAAAAALPQPPSSADSAKSLALVDALGSSAQPQAEGQQRSGSKDRGEKQFSSASRGQIGSDQGALLLTSAAERQPAQPQGRNSPPSRSADAAAASAGVGAGAGGASAAASAAFSLQAAFAAAATSFHHRKTLAAAPAASAAAAAAQHDGMCDVDDGAAAAGLSPAVLSRTSKHCLVVDIQQVAAFDADRSQLVAIHESAPSQQPEERIDAVVKWLPSLAGGLVWVLAPERQVIRLHLHFKDHASLVRALKDVPFLLRCGVPASSWGSICCSGLQRHEHPEALHFTCVPTGLVPSAQAELLSALKAFLTSIGIPVQWVWQSTKQVESQRANGPHARVTFWALPREADLDALVSLINRVHQQQTLFGGKISVQGPHSPQLARCEECRTLGHASCACPKFGGTAVRLRFKSPLGPYDFEQTLDGMISVRASMLGNTHSRHEWVPSHKATVFFATPSTAEEFAVFQQALLQLTGRCSDGLFEPPTLVDMSQAQRKLECSACGSRDKDHRCLSVQPTRPIAAPQRHQAAGKAAAPAAPAAAASSSSAAAAQTSAPKAQKALPLLDMCASWRKSRSCSRMGAGQCHKPHPQEWIVPPDWVCHQNLIFGSCAYGGEPKCKYKHRTLSELKAEMSTSATASNSAAAGASAPKPHVVKKAARTNNERAAACSSSSSNMFAPLSAAAAASAAAAPATPNKKSSLDSLSSPMSSPARSHSTPSRTPSGSAKKKLSLGSSAAARGGGVSAAPGASAAAAGDDGFKQVHRNKRRRTEQKEEGNEHAQSAARSAPPTRADAITVSDNEEMEPAAEREQMRNNQRS